MQRFDISCEDSRELRQFSGIDESRSSTRPIHAKDKQPSKSSQPQSNESENASLLNSGFVVRKVALFTIRCWLAIQVIGLVFQAKLWTEVCNHLQVFDELAMRECLPAVAPGRQCKSTMWNVTYSQEQNIRGGGSLEFTFETRSRPPTFLLNVNPNLGESGLPSWAPSYLADLEWSLHAVRADKPNTIAINDAFRIGAAAFTIEDLSEESGIEQRQQGHIRWRATLKNRGPHEQVALFSIFVEDALTPHLAVIQASPVCNFGSSWKAFNQQGEGFSHKALTWCRFAWGILPLLGSISIFLVLYESELRSKPVDRDIHDWLSQHRFHVIVFAKFLLHDMPQQIGFVLYFLGWFEAEGLKCQLCLFNVEFCEEEHPFKASNMVALASLLVSSVSNQMLLRPLDVKVYTELDMCWNAVVRLALGSISTLPFTTGIFMASGNLLSMPTLFHAAIGLPCYIGWCIVAGIVLGPLVKCYVVIVESCERSSREL